MATCYAVVRGLASLAPVLGMHSVRRVEPYWYSSTLAVPHHHQSREHCQYGVAASGCGQPSTEGRPRTCLETKVAQGAVADLF